jgi:hypothetical protein
MATFYGTVVDTSQLKRKGYGFIKPDDGDNIFFHIKGYTVLNKKKSLFLLQPRISN